MSAPIATQRNRSHEESGGVVDAEFKLAWLDEIISEGVVRQRFLPPHAGGPPAVHHVSGLARSIIDGRSSAGHDAGGEAVNTEPSSPVQQETRVPNHASNRWLQDPLRECARNANDNGGHARSLLDAGAATDDTDGVGRSPLHWAASRGNTQVVRALLDAGANISARDRAGKTPLHYARSSTTVEALVDHGMWMMQHPVATAPVAASPGGQVGEAGGPERAMVDDEGLAIVDARNAYGSTALHRAAFNGRERVVVALVKGGAGVGVLGKSGRSALHLACRNAHAGCVEILLAWGAEESTRAKDGSTPWDELAYAAEMRPPDDADVNRTALALRMARGGRAWHRRGWLLMLRAARNYPKGGSLADGHGAGDAGVSEEEEEENRGRDVDVCADGRGKGEGGVDLERLVHRLLACGEEGFFRLVVSYI